MRTLKALMILQLIMLTLALIGVIVLINDRPADLPPCPTEDSDNCIWDGATHGNGAGLTFVTLHGLTYYLTEH